MSKLSRKSATKQVRISDLNHKLLRSIKLNMSPKRSLEDIANNCIEVGIYQMIDADSSYIVIPTTKGKQNAKTSD